MTADELADKLNTQVPHSARVWNYWLGGKDNFAADRDLGDKVLQAFPTMRDAARTCRAYLGRTVTYLAKEAGIRQFLDIGTGLPTTGNTHQVAQAVAPECRVVYVDNDPLVLTHARALLTSGPQGETEYIDADLREPDKILSAPALLATLDLTQPVALVLVAVLHLLPDDAQAHEIVTQLVDALAPGSYVVAAHATRDGLSADQLAAIDAREFLPDFTPRTKVQIAQLLDHPDLALVEPGIVPVARWRPPPSENELPQDEHIATLGAVLVKR